MLMLAHRRLIKTFTMYCGILVIDCTEACQSAEAPNTLLELLQNPRISWSPSSDRASEIDGCCALSTRVLNEILRLLGRAVGTRSHAPTVACVTSGVRTSADTGRALACGARVLASR